MLDYLRRLVAHMRWADERVLEALRAVGDPPRKAVEIYAHVLGAEHVWLARLRQVPPAVAVWPSMDAGDLVLLAQANAEQYERFVSTLDGPALDREVPYTNSAGRSFRSTVGDILMQVALHASYHRGQVALLLRGAGMAPAPTDYIGFVRGVPAATRAESPPKT